MEYWPIFPLILGGMFTLVEGVMFWLGQPRWIHRLGLVARAGSERLAFAVPSVGQVTRLGDEEGGIVDRETAIGLDSGYMNK